MDHQSSLKWVSKDKVLWVCRLEWLYGSVGLFSSSLDFIHVVYVHSIHSCLNKIPVVLTLSRCDWLANWCGCAGLAYSKSITSDFEFDVLLLESGCDQYRQQWVPWLVKRLDNSEKFCLSRFITISLVGRIIINLSSKSSTAVLSSSTLGVSGFGRQRGSKCSSNCSHTSAASKWRYALRLPRKYAISSLLSVVWIEAHR